MDFDSFVEGPLLWIVFIVFLAAVIARSLFFVMRILLTSRVRKGNQEHPFAIFGRVFLPFHKAIAKKPIYAGLRYVFHFCLFVVPIWLAGHISLWEESRFEWSWTSLPGALADWMTLIFLGIAAYFVLRHFGSARLRSDASAGDFALILFAVLPFLTGYFLTHGSMEGIPFLQENMRLIHVLSAQAMIVMAAFLFYRSRLNPNRCTGCASCELSCPTGTLESKDEGRFRIFSYSHYQCICCGSCVNTCPEDAAELRHEISLRRFFQVLPKQQIRTVEMQVCQNCGANFVPEPLMKKIAKTFGDEYLLFCPNCRKASVAAQYLKLSPWAKKAGLPGMPRIIEPTSSSSIHLRQGT
jgi:formate hydrogenlyase subunit 6/NADH:ubiquinone oxidoreductase subunit I